MSTSPSALDPIVVPLIAGRSVLDVGCGMGRWGALISLNYWEAGISKKPTIDGMDAFKPNVEHCKKLPSYDKVWFDRLPCDLKGKWDTVLASEIIEHIPQEKVDEVMDIFEASANKRVIITTPNWPAFREVDDHDDGSNVYEAHLSYVSMKYLKKRGYKIIGTGFGNPGSWYIKLAQGIASKMRPKPKPLKKHATAPKQDAISQYTGQKKVRLFLESIARMFPSTGHVIIAYKDM